MYVLRAEINQLLSFIRVTAMLCNEVRPLMYRSGARVSVVLFISLCSSCGSLADRAFK